MTVLTQSHLRFNKKTRNRLKICLIQHPPSHSYKISKDTFVLKSYIYLFVIPTLLPYTFYLFL